jgi:SAM-dependent methyltransferase
VEVSLLDKLQQDWDALGRADPLWGVLSFPEMRGNRWEVNHFFGTGVEEVEAFMAQLDEIGLPVDSQRCLDFGCGVGRVTQVFARYFSSVDGVDVAPSMIERARAFNRHGDRCAYHVNARDDLRLFDDDTFDLVYTRIVLQHIPPELSRRYIPEFVRVLKPRGLAAFHVPSGPASAGGDTIALPVTAYRASLKVQPLPRVVTFDQQLICSVRVRNLGDSTWPIERARSWFHVGNHWLDRRGRVVVRDDGRAEMPHDLPPGGEAEVSLTLRVPRSPGFRVVQFDVVQEGVCWFAERGSETTEARVFVVPAAPRRRTSGDAANAAGSRPFEMHSLPKDEVLALISAAGGELVRTVESDTDGFHDVHYYVTKRR